MPLEDDAHALAAGIWLEYSDQFIGIGSGAGEMMTESELLNIRPSGRFSTRLRVVGLTSLVGWTLSLKVMHGAVGPEISCPPNVRRRAAYRARQ